MTDATDEDVRKGRGALVSLLAAVAIAFAAGALFYRWLFVIWKHNGWGADLAGYGQMGDALAPITAFGTLGALAAALWSVQLQREELRLQRQEMRESREELAKSAEAQRALATAQAHANEVAVQALEAQRDANRQAAASEHAARVAVVASLLNADAQMRSILLASRTPQLNGPPMPEAHAHIQKYLEEAQRAARQVGQLNAKGEG